MTILGAAMESNARLDALARGLVFRMKLKVTWKWTKINVEIIFKKSQQWSKILQKQSKMS